MSACHKSGQRIHRRKTGPAKPKPRHKASTAREPLGITPTHGANSLIGRARAIPRLAVFALALPLLLGACGGSGKKQAGVDPPSAPVETLYTTASML